MRLRAPALLFVVVVGGCAVDARRLSPSHTGGSGGGAGSASAGGSDDGGSAGDRGGPPNTDGLVDGCADLDTDGIADCQVTLVTNPSFASDDRDWTARAGTDMSWDESNALADAGSGSLKLTAEAPRAAAVQCVSLAGAKLVVAYASAFVEPEPAAAEPPRAELKLSFFPTADCSGPSERFFDTPPSSVTGAWTTVQAGGLALDTTRSVSVDLVGLGPSSAGVTVYFDNVMLKASEL